MSGRAQITVLMATRNQSATLRQALESILKQTLSPETFEVLVVNDGSTDETEKILKGYSDRVKTISQPPEGLVHACNRGLKELTTPFFARIDSDDFASSTWLSRCLETLLPHPDAVCVTPDYVEVLPDNIRKPKFTLERDLYTLSACGTLMRTEAVRQVGGYRPFYWEEYDLYLRLIQVGRFLHLSEPLYFYRRHSESMTADEKARRAGWQELIKTWGKQPLEAAGRSRELQEVLASPP